MPPPLDLELQLRRHGDALRALAAQLLRGADADDVVQEVWATALREPPRDAASVGGWLRTVLLHVASRWRRQRARRLRYEANAARSGVVEDHAAALAREELGHRLLAAVGALEPPYRDAIWQRFFEGKAPREVAAASGVPVATVKSRLQRGLGMLRERLGERQGTDWRAGFVVAFGLRAAATGALVMGTWTKVTAAIAAAAAAIAAVMFWPEPPAATPVAASGGGAPSAVAATAATAAPAAEHAAVADAPTERVAVPPAAVPDDGLATIRGRCVDENGAPLAGCTVEVRGERAGEERVASWLVDHGKLDWQDPPAASTGADGSFLLRLAPLPPLQFTFEFAREDRITMLASRSSVRSGEVVDLGEVVMGAGVIVRGRVVDGSGTPCENVPVSFHVRQPDATRGARGAVPRTFAAARSGAGGMFVANTALPAGGGEVQVQTREWRLRSAASLLLVAGGPTVVEIVVGAAPPTARILGRVVDVAERPIANANVTTSDRGSSARSTSEGTFELLARDGEPTTGAVRLVASANGFEQTSLDHDVAWGATDVVVRLAQAAGLTVRVTDELDVPIESFAVRVVPLGGPSFSGADARVRAIGPHADGTARIAGVRRGAHELVIQFPSASERPEIFHRLEATGLEQSVPLQSIRAQRALRVVRADGSPAAGTRVQLCQLPSGSFDHVVYAAHRDHWFGNDGQHVVRVLRESNTDAAGRCVLVGAAQQEHALRVLGPGHVPLDLAAVRLDVAGELVVTVERGGSLRGRVVPPEAAQELCRLAAVAGAASSANERGAKLQLRQEPPSRARFPAPGARDGEPMVEACRIAPDGSFEIRGVPPGDWHVGVTWWNTFGNGSSGTTTTDFAQTTITDGATTELDLDLGAIVPGTLRGTVLLDGAPLADATILLDANRDERAGLSSFHLRTDAHGRFDYVGPPRTFELLLWTGANKQRLAFRPWADGAVTMQRQHVTEHTFRVVTGRCRVRVVDGSGNPVAGLWLLAGERGSPLPATDERGCIDVVLPAAACSLYVLPRSLQPELDRRIRMYDGWLPGLGDELRARLIDLGTTTVVAGATTPIELRLPREWEK